PPRTAFSACMRRSPPRIAQRSRSSGSSAASSGRRSSTARTRGGFWPHRLRRVRIIAGSRKGHRIAAPKGLATRPTGDRVREAAFNLIGPVEDAAALDVFAGSGAMGLGGLARGARRCVFGESGRAAGAAIQANLEKLRLTGALVACQDAFGV